METEKIRRQTSNVIKSFSVLADSMTSEQLVSVLEIICRPLDHHLKLRNDMQLLPFLIINFDPFKLAAVTISTTVLYTALFLFACVKRGANVQ